MEDCYAKLLRMIGEGQADHDIAAVTGWPVDAVATLREELECALVCE